MMAEAATFISVPVKGKRRNVANTAMVLNSLASTLPLVMPDVNISLEESTKSAPISPEKEGVKKSKGFLKKHLSRPRSPHRHRQRNSQSDPESSSSRSPSSSPQPRPRWLPFKNKRKKSPSSTLNGDGDLSAVQSACLSVTQLVGGSMSSLDLEATPVHRLPGRSSEDDDTLVSTTSVPEIHLSELDIFPLRHSRERHSRERVFMARTPPEISKIPDHSLPKIMVSNESNEDVLEFVACEMDLDVRRKNSQSSRCSSGSGLVSMGTSGVGSLLLSPSGDESYPGSDLESPLSPYSGASSFTSDTPGELSDSDPIEKDYYGHDKDCGATPTPAQGEDGSPTSGGEGKELKGGKKKKENKVKVSVFVRA